MSRAEKIKERILQLQKEMGSSTLIAVSKYYPTEDIILAYEAGQREFGESRVQDLLKKSEELIDREINWHFIGHLQSNKINNLLKVNNLKYIHSIDSIKLLQELYKKEERFAGESLGFFLQVNTSDESEKSGFTDEASLVEAFQIIKQHSESKFYFCGLMTIGRIRTDDFERDAINCFSQLRSLRDSIDESLKLSMGMSSDYQMAIEHGSDFVRVGSGIFA